MTIMAPLTVGLIIYKGDCLWKCVSYRYLTLADVKNWDIASLELRRTVMMIIDELATCLKT